MPTAEEQLEEFDTLARQVDEALAAVGRLEQPAREVALELKESLEALQRYAPNMTSSNILGRYVVSPLDIERRDISLIKGDLGSGETSQEQLGIFRPLHGWGPNRTPIKRLYLCGPSTHPGGNVSGACGYNAVNVIADDLKLKKWWIK